MASKTTRPGNGKSKGVWVKKDSVKVTEQESGEPCVYDRNMFLKVYQAFSAAHSNSNPEASPDGLPEERVHMAPRECLTPEEVEADRRERSARSRRRRGSKELPDAHEHEDESETVETADPSLAQSHRGEAADAEKTEDGANSRITTVMLRNIPNQYKRDVLRERIEQKGFGGLFDFLYLPIDRNSGRNMGYAFINFRTPEACYRFFKAFNGAEAKQVLPGFRSSKICEVRPAEIQGMRPNFERMSGPNFLIHLAMHEDWQPLFLDENNERIPLPTVPVENPVATATREMLHRPPQLPMYTGGCRPIIAGFPGFLPMWPYMMPPLGIPGAYPVAPFSMGDDFSGEQVLSDLTDGLLGGEAGGRRNRRSRRGKAKDEKDDEEQEEGVKETETLEKETEEKGTEERETEEKETSCQQQELVTEAENKEEEPVAEKLPSAAETEKNNADPTESQQMRAAAPEFVPFSQLRPRVWPIVAPMHQAATLLALAAQHQAAHTAAMEAHRVMAAIAGAPRVPNTRATGSQGKVFSAIRKQVEFYFSKDNLCHDVFLRTMMDADGWVTLEELLNFPRLRQVARGWGGSSCAAAMASSKKVELSEDGLRVRVADPEMRAAFAALKEPHKEEEEEEEETEDPEGEGKEEEELDDDEVDGHEEDVEGEDQEDDAVKEAADPVAGNAPRANPVFAAAARKILGLGLLPEPQRQAAAVKVGVDKATRKSLKKDSKASSSSARCNARINQPRHEGRVRHAGGG